MKIPKVSTRMLMGIVLGVAVLLGLGLPAVDAYRNPEVHAHVWIDDTIVGRTPSESTKSVADLPSVRFRTDMDQVEIPFWHRYLRRLLGRTGKYEMCRPTGPQVELYCDVEYPEISSRHKNRIQRIGLPDFTWQKLSRMNGN